MKNILQIFLMIILSFSEANSQTWIKYGIADFEINSTRFVLPTDDGGAIMYGIINNNPGTDKNRLFKIDENGALDWSTKLQGVTSAFVYGKYYYHKEKERIAIVYSQSKGFLKAGLVLKILNANNGKIIRTKRFEDEKYLRALDLFMFEDQISIKAKLHDKNVEDEDIIIYANHKGKEIGYDLIEIPSAIEGEDQLNKVVSKSPTSY